MDDPQADAISLTNLADRKRSGGQRRAGDAMLEPDPTYDVDRKGLAGRACQPFAIEPSDDLFIIVSFRHRTNFSNKGSAGVDRMTVDQLGDYLKQHWPDIREQLLNGTYEPKPVRRVEIPKPDGGVRKLGIPTRRA